MQIRVAELRDNLKLLQPVIPRKPSLPVVTNVLLKDGKITGTDLETMVMVDMPDVDGECLLPHKKALDLLKFVPGGAWAAIEQMDSTVNLSWEGGNAEFDVPQTKEYPGVRDIQPESEGEISDGDSMVAYLKQTLPYCAKGEDRPMLSGVTVSFGETMEICAGDGFRMAYQILPLKYPAESRVTLPARSISLLCTIWEKSPPPMPIADDFISQIISKRHLNIGLSEERLSVKFGKVTLLSNLIQGTAPDFAQLVPKDPPCQVSVWAAELERCVNRVKGVSRASDLAVRLVWFDDKMFVSAKHEDSSVSAEMDAVTGDSIGKTAVALNYLHDYLARKEGVVTIGITSDKSPLLLSYAKAPLVVIMPMMVEWDKSATPQQPESSKQDATDKPESQGKPADPESKAKPKRRARRK